MTRAPSRRRRRIVVVTGTRAEYGILRSTLDAIEAHPRLSLDLVVTGMHLLAKFGSTVRQIERDGRRIAARVAMQKGDDDPLDQARGLSRGVRGIADFLGDEPADMVVVLGDRIEAMAGALAAVTTGHVLAHIHGGDIAPGDFDERLRHAITKLAHIHLPATRPARDRIIRMGEPSRNVYVVGAPGLDDIFELRRTLSRRKKPGGRALVLFHPCGRTAAAERRAMRAILRAVHTAELTPTILYPNTDRGHTGILAAIGEFTDHAWRNGRTPVVRQSLPRETFLLELAGSDVLIGNSSCGIIEAPILGVPSVNIGPRQEGRERAAATVSDADESEESICRALARALRSRPISSRASVYGHGGAGKRIANILASVTLDNRLHRKATVF